MLEGKEEMPLDLDQIGPRLTENHVNVNIFITFRWRDRTGNKDLGILSTEVITKVIRMNYPKKRV